GMRPRLAYEFLTEPPSESKGSSAPLQAPSARPGSERQAAGQPRANRPDAPTQTHIPQFATHQAAMRPMQTALLRRGAVGRWIATVTGTAGRTRQPSPVPLPYRWEVWL